MAQFKIPLQGSQSPSFLIIESETEESATKSAQETMQSSSVTLGEATEWTEDESQAQPS